jgi:uncharacterized MAPEG superfamily protein
MTIPDWMLLGFATWTLVILIGTVGVYRWSLILSGRAAVNAFPAQPIEGADWYRRGVRAHANCIENLPVFAVIVFAMHLAGVGGDLPNALTVAVMAARLGQSLVHLCLVQTARAVAVRFSFLLVQLVCFLWLIALIVRRLA